MISYRWCARVTIVTLRADITIGGLSDPVEDGSGIVSTVVDGAPRAEYDRSVARHIWPTWHRIRGCAAF